MSDLISRQAAIDALKKQLSDWNDYYNIPVRKSIENIERLPSVQQTLFGYKIEHLAYIARVMEKEGVTAECAVKTFDDMSRAVKMILKEAQQKAEEMLHERFNQQTGCD